MRRVTWVSVLVAAMAVGSSLAAYAAHPTQMCLDLEQEHTFAISNDDMIETLQAYPGATDAGHPAEHEECVTGLVEPGQDWGGTNIDFEIVEDADGDTPTTPDMTCTVGEGSSSCWVSPPTSESGVQTIRGWIDLDGDASADEADLSEAPDEDPDSMDGTDVVLWHWDTIDPGPCEPHICGPTDVTIRYRERSGVFHGTARSPRSECTPERTVKLRKVLRDGRHRTIDVTTSDAYGTWRIPGYPGVKGRYYAVATRDVRHTADPNWDVACLRARSSRIRVG